MKKVMKITIVSLCLLLIVFSVVKMSGFFATTHSHSNTDNINYNGVWNSDPIGDEKYRLTIELNEKTVYVEISDSYNNSRNGFYPIEELIDCNYKSSIVSWDLYYGDKEDVYASIVPMDCQSVEIDGKRYTSNLITIDTSDNTIRINTAIVCVAHSSKHTVFLIDKKEQKHREKNRGD